VYSVFLFLDYIVVSEHFCCPITAIGYLCNDLAGFSACKIYLFISGEINVSHTTLN
jgi:hypothetical protein